MEELKKQLDELQTKYDNLLKDFGDYKQSQEKRFTNDQINAKLEEVVRQSKKVSNEPVQDIEPRPRTLGEGNSAGQGPDTKLTDPILDLFTHKEIN